MENAIAADIRRNFALEVSNFRRWARGFDDASLTPSLSDPNLAPMDARNFDHPSSVRSGVARGWLVKDAEACGVRYYRLTEAGAKALGI